MGRYSEDNPVNPGDYLTTNGNCSDSGPFHSASLSDCQFAATTMEQYTSKQRQICEAASLTFNTSNQCLVEPGIVCPIGISCNYPEITMIQGIGVMGEVVHGGEALYFNLNEDCKLIPVDTTYYEITSDLFINEQDCIQEYKKNNKQCGTLSFREKIENSESCWVSNYPATPKEYEILYQCPQGSYTNFTSDSIECELYGENDLHI